jgi:hypothetical protein
MSNYNWKNGDSGNWGTAGDWQQNAVPNSTAANVTIASDSAIEVTIVSGETVTADSVTLDSVGVTLAVDGLLNLGGSKDQLLVNAGTLSVASTGTIANGTIVAGSGDVILNGGTLDNMTFLGGLNLTGANEFTYIMGGLTVLNASGTGPGTINIGSGDGSGDFLFLAGGEALDNVGINLEGGNIYSGNTGMDTLGSGVTVTGYGNFSGNGLLNSGTLDMEGLTVSTRTFDNSGVINMSARSYLTFEERITNTGEIISAGTVVLGGDQSLDQLGAISLTGNGLLNVHGNLNLDGGTLAAGGTGNIEISGTVRNGTINSALGPVTLKKSGATLDDITYLGNLDIADNNHTLTIEGGLHVVNPGGVGPGTINVTGEMDKIYFQGNQSLDNVVLNLGNASPATDEYLWVDNSDTLTLGTHTTVNSIFNDGFYGGGDVINKGTINVSGNELLIDASSFSNIGVINVAAGAGLDFGQEQTTFSDSGLIEGTGAGTSEVFFPVGTLFSDMSGTKLTAGEFEANPGNTLALEPSGVGGDTVTIKNDGGVLILNGAGSEITSKGSSLESTLQTISSGGTLKVIGDRGYTTGNTLDVNGGKLVLGGGTFSAALLHLAGPDSHFIGDGTLEGPIENAGAIIANAGTLVIDGPLSGGGALQIDAASTLQLTSGTSEAVSFIGADGGLILEAPALFTGLLGGIAAGDSIGLAGETASSASLSGASLLVTLTNHSVLDYTLASALPMEGVSVSNGSSGAELTFYQLPAAAAAPQMLFMQSSAHVADRPAPALRPASLPPLHDLWSGATQYRPFFSSLSGQASVTNLQHLQGEPGNMPTPANTGIVLAGLQTGELAHILDRNPPFAPLKGFF